MDRRRLKFVLLGAGIAVTMGLMMTLAFRQSDGLYYYLTVGEFLEQGARLDDGYRVNGKVAPGTIERLPSGEDVRFLITDGSATLPVAYHGIIPDTFVDEAEVVVQGYLQEDGTFQAQSLLAKCPSKYEAADGASESAYGPGGAASGE